VFSCLLAPSSSCLLCIITPKMKKKKPPDPLIPALLMLTAPCSNLSVPCRRSISRWFDSLRAHSLCPVLDRSRLRRCFTLVKSPWSSRNLTISPLKPSTASVDDLIAQLPAWHLLPVSPISHLLVFRSDRQVCFLPFSHSLFRVICCLDFHLLDDRLKPTLLQFGLRFKPTMVAFPFCWMVVKLGFFRAKFCWMFGHLCAEQLVAIRKDSLLPFSYCMPLGMCVDGISANFVQFGHYYGGYRVVNFGGRYWLVTDGFFPYSKPSARPLCGKPCLFFDLNQHAFLFRLPVGLADESPHGGWLSTYMLSFLASSTAIWFVVIVFWGLPLIWLSLPLKRQSAPKQRPLWSRFCWQLPLCPPGRDEVKGKAPGVNEDMLSEISRATYFVQYRGVCRVDWCFGAGTWHSFSWMTIRTEQRQDVCSNISSTIDSMVAFFRLSINYSVAMYCSFNAMFRPSFLLASPVMIEADRVPCITDPVVICIYGWSTPSAILCNSSFIRMSEQHSYVLGSCLMALDVHLLMLRPVHSGCCLIGRFVPLQNKLLAELRITLQVVGVKQSPWAAASVSSIGYYFGLYFCLLGMSSWQFFVPFCTRGLFDQLYYYSGYALTQLYCTKAACVAFISRYVISSTSCCSCSFTSNVAPHLSVLGPCLMALALHLTMLGTVYSGLCYTYCSFLAAVVVVVTPPLRLNMVCFYVSYGMYYFPVLFYT